MNAFSGIVLERSFDPIQYNSNEDRYNTHTIPSPPPVHDLGDICRLRRYQSTNHRAIEEDSS